MLPDNSKESDAILVATDDSPAARSAANVAIQIAQSQDLLIRGLHVVDEALILDPYANYQAELGSAHEATSQAELVARFEERGDKALAWLEGRCKTAGVWVSVEMIAGGVPELVREQAEKAQLVALGRRGRAHAGDADHLGDNFQAIAHNVQTSILAGGGETRPVQRLLLAYNASEQARRALDWAGRLQRTLPADVIVLAVQERADDPAQQWLQDAVARLEENDAVVADRATRVGQPAAEIVAAAQEYAVDLIVMGRYRHSALVEWLVGSAVDRVLRSTPLPVLIAG